jgi:hypothetical protein
VRTFHHAHQTFLVPEVCEPSPCVPLHSQDANK